MIDGIGVDGGQPGGAHLRHDAADVRNVCRRRREFGNQWQRDPRILHQPGHDLRGQVGALADGGAAPRLWVAVRAREVQFEQIGARFLTAQPQLDPLRAIAGVAHDAGDHQPIRVAALEQANARVPLLRREFAEQLDILEAVDVVGDAVAGEAIAHIVHRLARQRLDHRPRPARIEGARDHARVAGRRRRGEDEGVDEIMAEIGCFERHIWIAPDGVRAPD
jgi:hypothetical protein